jgi:hypothetical protein
MNTGDIGQTRRHLFRAIVASALLGLLPLSTSVAQDEKPTIGLIGSGNVGSALGRTWARAGYECLHGPEGEVEIFGL